jgi:hypothetical protein
LDVQTGLPPPLSLTDDISCTTLISPAPPLWDSEYTTSILFFSHFLLLSASTSPPPSPLACILHHFPSHASTEQTDDLSLLPPARSLRHKTINIHQLFFLF